MEPLQYKDFKFRLNTNKILRKLKLGTYYPILVIPKELFQYFFDYYVDTYYFEFTHRDHKRYRILLLSHASQDFKIVKIHQSDYEYYSIKNGEKWKQFIK